MGNITFVDARALQRTGLSEKLVIDIIELLYEGSSDIVIIDHHERAEDGKLRGRYISQDTHHEINTYSSNICEAFRRGTEVGGNLKHSDVRAAFASVILHELRHAMQAEKFVRGTKFWRGKYYRRACEVDARRFSDENIAMVEEMIGIPEHLRTERSVSVDDVAVDDFVDMTNIAADMLLNNQTDVASVKQYLSAIGRDNAVNVARVLCAFKDTQVERRMCSDCGKDASHDFCRSRDEEYF